MSDGAPNTTSSRQPAEDEDARRAASSSTTEDHHTTIAQEEDSVSWQTTLEKRFAQKRIALLQDLFNGIEYLLYVQLGVLYYLDNLSLLLLLRSTTQRMILVSLTLPTALQSMSIPTVLAQALERQQNRNPTSQIAMSLALTAFAILVHAFMKQPSAGEQTRGYLHGGLIIDFVGQKAVSPWFSRIRLIACDLLVLFLQLTAVIVSKEINKWSSASRGAELGNLVSMTVHRERDVVAESRVTEDSSDDTEMRPLTQQADDEDILVEENQKLTDVERLLDSMTTGQAIITSINPRRVLAECIMDVRNRRTVGGV